MTLSRASTDADVLDAYAAEWAARAGSGSHTYLFREYAVLSAIQELRGAVSVLDVGCGRGTQAQLLARFGYEVSVFDASEAAAKNAAAAVKAVGGRLGPCYAGLWEAVKAPEPMADVVVCCEVLEHTRDPAAFYADLARAARFAVIITTPVGHGYDDPLHLWHWHTQGELESALDLRSALDVWAVHRLPSRIGDRDRVWFVAGRVKSPRADAGGV